MFDFAGGVNYGSSYSLIIVASEKEGENGTGAGRDDSQVLYNCSHVPPLRLSHTAISCNPGVGKRTSLYLVLGDLRSQRHPIAARIRIDRVARIRYTVKTAPSHWEKNI